MSVENVNSKPEHVNENAREIIENYSEEALQSNAVLKLDSAVDLLNDTKYTDQSTDIIGNMTEYINNTNDDSEDDILQKISTVKKKKFIAIVDSDSEEENLPLATSLSDSENENFPEPTIEAKKKKRRRLAVADSDSDIENEIITLGNKSYSDEELNIEEQVNSDTNPKEELVSEISGDITNQNYKLSMLCDPESSDEEIDKENKEKEYNFAEVKPKPYKKINKPKKDEDKNPKKMTGKEAAELRKEIKSESQRMVREMNVSLPYHKPKSYTLKEFLARRPKLVSATSLAVRTPPSVAIKMSTEQLAVITKKLKEREKEVKEFYKSESESEDVDGDKDYLPPTRENDEEPNGHYSKNTNTVSMEPLESVSDEIKDISQDKIEIQDISGNLKNHLEGNVVKHFGVKENNMVTEELTSQELNEMTASVDKNNRDSESSMHSEDCVNNSNVNNNLNYGETGNLENEKESIDSEVVEENSIFCEISNAAVSNTGNSSMGYEFNLDDLEENSERPIIENAANNIEIQKARFEYTDLDKEIENFCSNDEEKSHESTIMIPKKVSKLELIKERIANIKPKLSGGPDDVIDLETGVAKPNDVTRLMERFAQHTLKKHTHKHKVKLSIVSVESGEIHKETVAMNVEDEDDLLEVEEKPGVRLQKLRDDLQNQIAQKRSELWQKKATNEVCDEEDIAYEGEKEECDADDDFLDDEEEEVEMTDLSEDEENFDNHEAKQIKHKKSAFIDEEAEESDRDDDEENEDDIDADIKSVQIKDFSEVDLNKSSELSNISENTEEQPTKKILRRIVKGFTEDSDDEDDDNGLISQTADLGGNANQNFSNIVSQDDDDFLPPHQPQSSQTPVRQITQSKSEFEFLTPISFITGLQNLNNSASKSLKGSPVMSSFQITNEPSPLKENNWHHNLQKKLFTDSDITNSQFEEIAGICSGKFPETQEVKEADAQEMKEANIDNEKELVNVCSGTFSSTLDVKGNETQLLDVCSGTFPSSLEVEKDNLSNNEPPSTQDLLNICSGKFTGATQIECTGEQETDPKCTIETYMFNTNKELKSLDADQDMIISQLIDEEEMEKFKRKFDSPLLSNTQKRIVEEFEEVMGSGGVIDSDDEDEILEVKKKKQKRIMFSDDENSDEDENEEEVIDLHDDVGCEVDEDDTTNIPTDNIGYDSEENEVELVEQRAGPRPKPSDFFENEAELSESEWGSADEDERDLDTMEFEQGDAEKFDEKKIRSDLEKIHMRRLLDDDTREIKMLQELLLEDGELHGTGRERQFRWKNINSTEDGNEERKDEDDVYIDEEESEEQWRKMRYEREMFLKEKQNSSHHLEDDGLLSESQLLKIGHKVIQRSQSNYQGSTPLDKTKVTPASPDIKQPFNILNKRGSFLSRSDQVLQRLAEYSKVTSVTLGSAKNSRNFLFQTVSVEETSISVNQDKKRKATDGTPNAIKKLRLSNNLSPAVHKKNPDKSVKAKLFGDR